MTLDDALADVKLAFLQVEFLIKLLSYCELEKINLAEFDATQIVLLEHGNLRIPPGNFRSLEDVVRAASVSVSLALGASALVLDKAWETAGILPNPQSADGRIKLRTLVYMVRCAYAHGLADPKWEVRGGFRQVFEVDLPGAPLTLDLRELLGQAFDFDVLGGHARWFEIRDASVATINA